MPAATTSVAVIQTSAIRTAGELRGTKLFAPRGVERAQPLDAFADRRMRDEQRGEAFLGERVDRVERLRRRVDWN